MESAYASRTVHSLGRIEPASSGYMARTYSLDKPRALTSADTAAMAVPFVFVVDPDPCLHESLEVSGRCNGWQVRQFDCARAFLDSPPILGPSCVVVNASMPEFDLLDLQESIAIDRPGMPIVLVVGPSGVPLTIQAGAVSMVMRSFATTTDERVVRAIVKALERSRPAFGQWAHTALLRKRYESLTNRERQVMALVVSGRLNKQVGGDLGISEITVKAHRGNTMRKMQAKSLSSLVTMAANLGLNSPGRGAC